MFLPENIDLAKARKYKLSIRQTSNGFSFYIYSITDKNVFHYQNVKYGNHLSVFENIKKTFFEVNFFTHQFNKLNVINVTQDYTIVPNPFFEDNKIKEIFKFNIFREEGKVLSCYLESQDCHIIYDMDKDLHSFYIRTLCNPVFKNSVCILIPFFAKYQAENDSKRCFVDFHDEFVTVICFQKDKLLSANTFLNDEKENTQYYIINVIEKIEFNQKTDLLFLSGDLKNNKETIEILQTLIENTNPVEIKPEIVISDEEKKELPTDILISLCE